MSAPATQMRSNAHAQLCSYAKAGALRETQRPVPLDQAAPAQLRAERKNRGIELAEDVDCDCDEPEVDAAALDQAAGYLGRGDLPEALVYLERALPPSFSGLADRAARFYRSPT